MELFDTKDYTVGIADTFGAALYQRIEKYFIADFRKVWDRYEREGELIYCIAKFRGVWYYVSELSFGDGVYLDGMKVFEWSETDTADKTTMTKIKKALKDFIIQHEAALQIKHDKDLLINS